MATFQFDMYQTLGLAVLVLLVGRFLRKRIYILDHFCIPEPVIGGLLFAILTCILHVSGIITFEFNDTLKEVCMVLFFTSVGFQANLKVLKSGGKALIVFLIVIIIMIFCQDLIAVGLAKALGLSPLLGMCTGSIPMVGGHGTAGAFGPILEDLGVSGASTVATAAATFGLIMGSLLGGPIAQRLIEKRDLMHTAEAQEELEEAAEREEVVAHSGSHMNSAMQLIIAAAVGTVASYLLTQTGMTFPVYIGALIVGAIIRNISEISGKFHVDMAGIDDIGDICLSLFLGIAMITLQIWQLAALAIPMILLLAAQTIFMFLFSRFVVFNVMGRDYDAAILSAGCCGFGMGATPNAMANMQAVCDKYVLSIKAFILVPIMGSLFVDFINSLVVTLFINVL